VVVFPVPKVKDGQNDEQGHEDSHLIPPSPSKASQESPTHDSGLTAGKGAGRQIRQNKRPPKGGQVIKQVVLSWQDNSIGNSRAASGFAVTISVVESGDLVSRLLNMRKEAAHNQQTAFQPSGNGMNPQASWLSLAAFGNGWNVDG
jgi:hypothetical protein